MNGRPLSGASSLRTRASGESPDHLSEERESINQPQDTDRILQGDTAPLAGLHPVACSSFPGWDGPGKAPVQTVGQRGADAGGLPHTYKAADHTPRVIRQEPSPLPLLPAAGEGEGAIGYLNYLP